MQVDGVLVMCLALLMCLIFLWPVTMLSYSVNLAPLGISLNSIINIIYILSILIALTYKQTLYALTTLKSSYYALYTQNFMVSEWFLSKICLKTIFILSQVI